MLYHNKILQALSVPCLVLKPETNDFRVFEANDAYLNLTLRTREELVNTSAKSLYLSYTDPQSLSPELFFQSLQKVVRTGKKKKIKQCRLDLPKQKGKKSRESFWKITNSPIFDERGQLEFILHSLYDITGEVNINKKKKKLLRESQRDRERNQHFFERNPDGLYLMDSEGNFTSVNESLGHILGVPVQELLKRDFLSICHPSYRDQIRYHFRKAAEGEPTRFEAPFLPPKGSEMLLEVNLIPLKLKDKVQAIYGITKDKTALWEAEKVVIKKNNFLKAHSSFISGLFEKGFEREMLEKTFATIGKTVGVDRMYYFRSHRTSKGEAVLSIDLEWKSEWVSSKIEDPLFKDMNRELFLKVLPLEPDTAFNAFTRELKNEQLKALFLSKEVKSLLILPIFVKEKLHSFIGFDDCKNERIWKEEEIEFLQSLSRNMTTALEKRVAETELLEKENALAQSERKFKALVQEGSDMLAILDRHGRYTFASDSRRQILGIAPEEILGQTLAEQIHPEDVEAIQEKFNSLAPHERIQLDFRVRTNTGDWRWVESIFTNMLEDPAVQGIVTNSRDITKSVLATKKIKRQNEVLREIAWEQSHIVRAPLAKILGLLQLIEVEGTAGPAGSAYLNHLKTSADELDSIIHTIVRKSEEVGAEGVGEKK